MTCSSGGSGSTGRRSGRGPAGSTPTRSATRDPAKSIGHEHTFDVDTSDPEVIERTLLAMADGVGVAAALGRPQGGHDQVKIRDSTFRTITRQRTLADPTDLTEPIWRVALELARPEVRGLKVRLLGVTASHLGERQQLGLFEAVGAAEAAPGAEGAGDRRRRATQAADAIRRRYGDRAVTRARLLGRTCGAVRARPDEAARTRTGMRDEPAPDDDPGDVAKLHRTRIPAEPGRAADDRSPPYRPERAGGPRRLPGTARNVGRVNGGCHARTAGRSAQFASVEHGIWSLRLASRRYPAG